MKNDLISRAAAIDALCKACANGEDYLRCRDRDIKSRWCDTITVLRDLPSAQPEIIRCKDCKYFAGEGMYCENDIIVHFDHFYCYNAERRTDE